jgi:hypothetical protein
MLNDAVFQGCKQAVWVQCILIRCKLMRYGCFLWWSACWPETLLVSCSGQLRLVKNNDLQNVREPWQQWEVTA